MDDLRIGHVLRTVRRRKRPRQVDVGAAAGLSQQTVSDLERGRLADVTVRTVRYLGAVLEVSFPLDPRWRGPELHRLLDADHAAMVGLVVSHLQGLGWIALVEWSFNHYGDRGSIDVVALHRPSTPLPSWK